MTKEISIKADMIQGCINRMCITDSQDELSGLYTSLMLYTADLYRLNRKKLFIAKSGYDAPPTIEL